MQVLPYGFGTVVAAPFEEAASRVREELAAEGFGILTEIDVRATLEKKLGVEFRPYVILGACNPSLAHKALSQELDIGLLLPCNVVVRASDDPAQSVVMLMDPVATLSLVAKDAVGPLADEIRDRLERVVTRLGTQG